MLAYTKTVTQKLCVNAMHKAGLMLLPGGSDARALNSKLKASMMTKLKPKAIPEPKVDLNAQELSQALSAYEHVEEKKLTWKCENPGCSVVFQKKHRYVKNTHPADGITHHTEMFILLVISSLQFEESTF